MTVEFATGDLFDPNFGFDAIGHGVNCKGVMGSGIAVEFKNRFPRMFARYRDMCHYGYLKPGQVFAHHVMPDEDSYGRIEKVYNIASQFNPGWNGDYDALRIGFAWTDYHAVSHGLTHVGLPQIGCGIAGLDWDTVRGMAAEHFTDSPVNYTFVTWG